MKSKILAWYSFGTIPYPTKQTNLAKIVMDRAMWKRHPTHMKKFKLIKVNGIGYEKPHVYKKKKKKNLTFIWKCIHNRIHILCCSPPTWYWPWVSSMSKFWKYFTFILDCHRAKEFWIALLGQWEIFIFP